MSVYCTNMYFTICFKRKCTRSHALWLFNTTIAIILLCSLKVSLLRHLLYYSLMLHKVGFSIQQLYIGNTEFSTDLRRVQIKLSKQWEQIMHHTALEENCLIGSSENNTEVLNQIQQLKGQIKQNTCSFPNNRSVTIFHMNEPRLIVQLLH